MLATIRSVATGLAAVIEPALDFLLALARHLLARFRRRFINADSPVFSFADERDYARFCRWMSPKHSGEFGKATRPSAY